jgi:hypothetical protein
MIFMKYLPLFCLFSFFSVTAFEKERSKPIIRVHCDVNKTIICTDSVKKDVNVAGTVNGILTEFTFAKWDGHNNCSYHAFVTEKIARENPELSRISDTFKQKRLELLKNFPHFLQDFPELLAKYENDKKRMMEILSLEKMVIFPSFFKLISWLNEHYKNQYAIYLRTFGTDLPEVMADIAKKSDLKFAGIVGFKERNLPSYIELFRSSHLLSYGIQDNYDYWKSKGFQADGGKPFPVDEKEIDIFYDDNANDLDKPIICPISSEQKILDTQELLKQGIIVAVNPKEAILNEDYFVKLLQARIERSK